MSLALKRTPFARLPEHTARAFHEFGAGYLPGMLGLETLSVEPARVVCRAAIRQALLAPTGYVHGGAVTAIADTACGYGAIVNLPEGASGFVTIELHTNFLGTARAGALVCTATPLHIGRSTQVWDAVVRDEASERTLAMFRCTQMVLRDPR
jgi:1,4-dihydroxy-2-naphthoyl-CoA hydrolase